MNAANFEGHAARECGEHRTVGPHRAWCYDCSEWCYPRTACKGCEVVALRARLAEVEADLHDACQEARESNHAAHAHLVRAETAEARLAAVEAAEPFPACRGHHEVQHRDGRPPWCEACGWHRGRPPVQVRHVPPS